MARYQSLLIIPVAGLLTLEAASAMTPRNGGENLVAVCIRRAAAGRPWLERTLWGLRDQEGGWIGARRGNKDGSFDLGPLQINSWWVPRIAKLVGRTETQVSWWLRHDACFNADAARWIFLSALAVTGDYWRAVGLYHSPTAWRQRRYALRVAFHLTRRYGEGAFNRRGAVIGGGD